jgi:hypothetical protein
MWFALVSAIAMPVLVGVLLFRVQLSGRIPDDAGTPYVGL